MSLRDHGPTQATNVFAGKHGYITPRDLFKWAGRGAVGYQQLAESGYLLLAERLRSAPERAVVQDVLESIMRVKVGSHTGERMHLVDSMHAPSGQLRLPIQ